MRAYTNTHIDKNNCTCQVFQEEEEEHLSTFNENKINLIGFLWQKSLLDLFKSIMPISALNFLLVLNLTANEVQQLNKASCIK